MKRFRVIDGSGKPAEKKAAKLATCHECNGSTFIPVKSSIVEGHEDETGLTELLCAQCLTEGKLTTL